MLVDWRGVGLVLVVLGVVVAFCALDLSCTEKKGPAVLARVKGELDAGRKEYLTIRRDQLAEQLRDLRVLNRRLVEQGEKDRSRELTRLLVDLENQYQHVSRALETSK